MQQAGPKGGFSVIMSVWHWREGTVWYFSSRFNGRPESQGIIRILASRSAQHIAAAVHTMYTVHRRRTEIVRINRSTQYTQYTGRCTYRCAYKVPSIKKSFLMRENLNFYYFKIFFFQIREQDVGQYNGSKLPNSIYTWNNLSPIFLKKSNHAMVQ